MKAKPVLVVLIVIFLLSFALSLPLPAPVHAQQATCPEATLHYRRMGIDYEGWGLHIWGPNDVSGVTWDSPYQPAGQDEFGIYWIVPMQAGAEFLNYIVHQGDLKDPGPDQTMTFAQVGCEIWLATGQATQYASAAEALASMNVTIVDAPALAADQTIIHYVRRAGDYAGWGLHIWGPTSVGGITWEAPLMPAGQDNYGIFWVVAMQPGADHLNYIVHKGDVKDPGPDQKLTFADKGREIWLIEGSAEQYPGPDEAMKALNIPGDIVSKAKAHFLSAEYLAWPVEVPAGATFKLHFDPAGQMTISEKGLEGGKAIDLAYFGSGAPLKLRGLYPYLEGAAWMKILPNADIDITAALKGQLALSMSVGDKLVDATALQIPYVLDDLYEYDGALGVTWEGDVPTIRLWAPTARSVKLHLFADSRTPGSSILPMTYDAASGVWSITGEPGWKNQFYLYEMDVWVRTENAFVQNLVTDPYSFSLSMNSTRSQIVDLNDPALKPAGWDDYTKPAIAHPTDIVLYELHVRDFSAGDESVLAAKRGTFMAFTETGSNGMKHLARLAAAGVTHVHLLPVFDIATIEEDKSLWPATDWQALAALPGDSKEQQAVVQAQRDSDAFNWGYDPYHFTAPEGSYSTDPDGTARILEFRQMVMALNQSGLRVVMDVVYNHTSQSGQSEKSVFDKIVPGYYHRLNPNGSVYTSTCCQNTATEHEMMGKFMIDSVLTWTTQYKVDGYRFDLMGHHMVENMTDLRAALDALTPEKDGVDGKEVYVYGEGWNFGEVADNARGVNATQLNLPGSGIGTFNDRLRDAARGGSPFGGLQEQGFINSLYTGPNAADPRPAAELLSDLLLSSDQIRVGLAGNLADYAFENAEGRRVTGKEVAYNGQPTGYTQMPQEHISYISAHDNETLFDAIQYKAPRDTSMADRVRMHNMGIDLVALGQGVPFFHAGDEILRSKSLDRNSYNSGDWFNAIDWTYNDNNWAHGLPPESDNGGNWPIMAELLADPALKPAQTHILAALDHFTGMVAIRKSSPLFRLQTADEVMRRLAFHNTGPDQLPGLIVMTIANEDGLDPIHERLAVFFNGAAADVNFAVAWEPGNWVLHPLQAAGADEVVKRSGYDTAANEFHIPARTTAVFVVMAEPSAPDAREEEPTPEEATPTPPTATASPAAEAGRATPWVLIIGLGGAAALGLGVYAYARRKK
jgi:pullulanase